MDRDTEALIRRSVQAISTSSKVLAHAIGVMPDHVHIAVSVPQRIAVAEFAKQVKGSTSHLINRRVEHPVGDWFFWQPEYGVITFGERSLERVVAYLENQPDHHASKRLWPTFERIDEHQLAKHHQ